MVCHLQKEGIVTLSQVLLPLDPSPRGLFEHNERRQRVSQTQEHSNMTPDENVTAEGEDWNRRGGYQEAHFVDVHPALSRGGGPFSGM